jgi:hypothetical protein
MLVLAQIVHEIEMTKESESKSRRKRVGRVICILSGLAMLITIFGGLVLSVVALSGVTQPMIAYNQYAPGVFVVGILSLLVGIGMILLPEGLSEDGTWVQMTGPYAGTN